MDSAVKVSTEVAVSVEKDSEAVASAEKDSEEVASAVDSGVKVVNPDSTLDVLLVASWDNLITIAEFSKDPNKRIFKNETFFSYLKGKSDEKQFRNP